MWHQQETKDGLLLLCELDSTADKKLRTTTDVGRAKIGFSSAAERARSRVSFLPVGQPFRQDPVPLGGVLTAQSECAVVSTATLTSGPERQPVGGMKVKPVESPSEASSKHSEG